MEEEPEYMKRMIQHTQTDSSSSVFTKNKQTDRSFDPEKLVVRKPEILEFCDRVLKKWESNPIKNTKNILSMNIVKESVVWTDDESLKAIWSEILAWTFELLYENAVSQNEEEWIRVMKKIKEKRIPD
jgi:hypothetical protein